MATVKVTNISGTNVKITVDGKVHVGKLDKLVGLLEKCSINVPDNYIQEIRARHEFLP